MARGKLTRESADPISALESAASELVDLAEEMSEWASNMSNANMDHMDKFQAVEECAETLNSAELGPLAETLSEKLNEAVEGEDGNAACPAHEWGVPCSNCGWDGNATKLIVVDPANYRVWKSYDEKAQLPMRITVGRLVRVNKTRVYGSSDEITKFNAAWEAGDVPPEGAIERAIERMAPRQAKEEALLRQKPAPAGLSFVAQRAPLTQLGELLAGKVEWSEFHAYGKKPTSRSDRFGNAMAAAQAARVAIGSALELLTFDDEESPEAELVDEIREAFGELEEAIAELEGGVEFPGMYG